MNNRNIKFAKGIVDKMKSFGIRVELDDRSETVSKKIHDSAPSVVYIVTVGDKEEKSGKIAVRGRDGKNKFGVDVDAFIEELVEKINERC